MDNSNIFLFKWKNRNPVLASWFFASKPNNYIINKMLDKWLFIWKTQPKKMKNYKWWHEFVQNDLLKNDEKFKKEWDNIANYYSAEEAHLKTINNKKNMSPVFKLSYKNNTVLHKLKKIDKTLNL